MRGARRIGRGAAQVSGICALAVAVLASAARADPLAGGGHVFGGTPLQFFAQNQSSPVLSGEDAVFSLAGGTVSGQPETFVAAIDWADSQPDQSVGGGTGYYELAQEPSLQAYFAVLRVATNDTMVFFPGTVGGQIDYARYADSGQLIGGNSFSLGSANPGPYEMKAYADPAGGWQVFFAAGTDSSTGDGTLVSLHVSSAGAVSAGPCGFAKVFSGYPHFSIGDVAMDPATGDLAFAGIDASLHQDVAFANADCSNATGPFTIDTTLLSQPLLDAAGNGNWLASWASRDQAGDQFANVGEFTSSGASAGGFARFTSPPSPGQVTSLRWGDYAGDGLAAFTDNGHIYLVFLNPSSGALDPGVNGGQPWTLLTPGDSVDSVGDSAQSTPDGFGVFTQGDGGMGYLHITGAPGSGGGGKGSVAITTALSTASESGPDVTAIQGRSVSDRATLTPQSPGGPPPTGSVTFTVYDSDLCEGAPVVPQSFATVSAGMAQASIFAPGTATDSASLPGGTYWVRAQYSGDQNYNAAESCVETITFPHYDLAVTIEAHPSTVDLEKVGELGFTEPRDRAVTYDLTVENAPEATIPSPATELDAFELIGRLVQWPAGCDVFEHTGRACPVPSLDPGQRVSFRFGGHLPEAVHLRGGDLTWFVALIPACGQPTETRCDNNEAKLELHIAASPEVKMKLAAGKDARLELAGTASPVAIAPPALAASAADVLAPADKVASVQVAVRREGPGCEWLNKHGTFTAVKPHHGRCDKAIWLRAQGTAHWRYELGKLARGTYVALARATSRAGATDFIFSGKLRNLLVFAVR